MNINPGDIFHLSEGPLWTLNGHMLEGTVCLVVGKFETDRMGLVSFTHDITVFALLVDRTILIIDRNSLESYNEYYRAKTHHGDSFINLELTPAPAHNSTEE